MTDPGQPPPGRGEGRLFQPSPRSEAYLRRYRLRLWASTIGGLVMIVLLVRSCLGA